MKINQASFQMKNADFLCKLGLECFFNDFIIHVSLQVENNFVYSILTQMLSAVKITVLKAQFTPQNVFFCHVLTLKLFETCMCFSLL